jgi:hypothetical protein
LDPHRPVDSPAATNPDNRHAWNRVKRVALYEFPSAEEDNNFWINSWIEFSSLPPTSVINRFS